VRNIPATLVVAYKQASTCCRTVTLTNEHACKVEQKAVTFSCATANSNKQIFPQNSLELLQ